MDVGIVVWHLNVKGGTQRQAIELARQLRSKGHRVTFYCAWLDRASCYESLLEPFEILSLHSSPQQPQRDKLRWVLSYLEPLFVGEEKRLARMIGRHDVLNCHEHRAYRVGYFCRKATGTPVVWMMNDLPTSMRRPKRPKTTKMIKTLAHYLVMGGLLARWLEVRRAETLDEIVVLDFRNKENLQTETGMSSIVIRSGLDLDRFKFTERSPFSPKDPFTLFTLGIFFPYRRFEDLVSALHILKSEGREARLRIAGLEATDRDYSARIRALVSSLGLEDRIELLGAISEEQLNREYSSADAFAFPHSPQTWGLSVFEAMACGTPVIVSSGCGASEVLSDRRTALIVKPGRPEEFAAAVKMLVNDPSLGHILSVSGRRFVEENVRWDLYADRMLRVFKNVSESKDVRF